MYGGCGQAGDEGRPAQERRDAQALVEPSAVLSAVIFGKPSEGFAPAKLFQPARNHACQHLAALQCHQHPASRERVYKGCGIAYGQEAGRWHYLAASEAMKRHAQPGRGRACALKREPCTLVRADEPAHHALGVAAALSYIARTRNEAEVVEAIFVRAYTAVAASIKVDFAMTGLNASVLKMSFEGYERRARLPPESRAAFDMPGESASPARGVNRNERANMERGSHIRLQLYAAHSSLLYYQIMGLRLFQHRRPGLSRSLKKARVHLRTAQPQSAPLLFTEPGAGDGHLSASPGIKDRLGKTRSARRHHSPGDAQLLKVQEAFRRDEFAAQLLARKPFLLDKEDTRAQPREVNRGARPGRPCARDDRVIFSFFHHPSFPRA
jgi:hypothetical protein